MSTLLAARAQMGTSLVFHIIFSVLGVGLPLLLCIAEGLAIQRKDPVWMALARRWATAAVIIFAIGAVSGTIVEFELGMLWPTYIKFIGAVIGPLFAFEGFAFFLEAIISMPGIICRRVSTGCAHFPSGLVVWPQHGLLSRPTPG